MTVSYTDFRTLQDFMAFVKREDWQLAYAGDEAAKRRIAEELDGVDLYFHAGPHMDERYIGVTLPDLLCHGIIPRVTLHKSE